MKQCLEHHNIVWLPPTLFDWSNLGLHSDIFNVTTFAHNGLRQRFQDQQAQRAGDQAMAVDRILIRRMQSVDPQNQRDLRDLILNLQQIVYRGYILHIFHILGPDHLPRLEQQSAQVRKGYGGISCDLVTEILGHPSTLSLPRETAKSTHFSRYPFTWEARLQLLFDWDDEFPGSWRNLVYRLRAPRFHDLLQAHVSVDVAKTFRESLGKHAIRYIWTIPRYDASRL